MRTIKDELQESLDDMGDDNFTYDESLIRLTARRSGRHYDIGGKVRVSIKRTSLEERRIDLSLVEGE